MLIAGVAQSVEQRIRNAQVGGSSPFTSSIDFGLNCRVWAEFFLMFRNLNKLNAYILGLVSSEMSEGFLPSVVSHARHSDLVRYLHCDRSFSMISGFGVLP